ncbi:PepSY-associated TM helix domain-containing protein [gamma proteobacterium BDW918]|nr:PepSY domain-containing protein [Zhongshania aliphaticivorans]EIF42266.1 PepSY-associated TM helix domain-containing protein [gamma proteobacterium BDW918]
MSPYRIFRMLLLRWHRRIGVVAALFVVVLVVTGIAINHSDDWGLDKKPLKQAWLLKHYGIPSPVLRSFPLNKPLNSGAWLSQLGDGLYLAETQIGSCDSPLLGVVVLPDTIAVLCAGRLQLFTPAGEKLDDISESLGLPRGAEALALDGEAVLLRTPAGVIAFDPRSFMFSAMSVEGVAWAAPALAPPIIQRSLLDQYRGSGLSWERLLLDLHSGRLFGSIGVYIMDLAAIALLLIALSGVWVWVSKPGRWKRPS